MKKVGLRSADKMEIDMGFEDMLEHVCGFCDKIFKKEAKLDIHIKNNHMQQFHSRKEENNVQSIPGIEVDKIKIEDEVETKPVSNVTKVRKMNKKYDNLYLHDPTTNCWICVSCGATYQSDHGLRCHLKITRCGFGTKDNYKPKMNYKTLYMKSDGQLTCCGCGIAYQSERGIYHHLNQTICGFGTKERTLHKKDWDPFYKIENNIFICVVCNVNYDTIRGMHYHLKRKCGVDAKLKVFSPKVNKERVISSPDKRDFKQFYKKEEDSTLTCLGCATVYHSMKGIKSHLKTTKCGFGDRFRSPPKTNYLQLYSKEGEQYICNRCGRVYNSSRGVHHHLKSTRCGFGEKEGCSPRNNYTAMYSNVDGQYECKRCGFKIAYMQGMHNHLKTCVAGFIEELARLAEDEKLDVKDGIKEDFDRSVTVNDLGELNTFSGASRKKVNPGDSGHLDFDEINNASEKDIINKSQDGNSKELKFPIPIANLSDFDLD